MILFCLVTFVIFPFSQNTSFQSFKSISKTIFILIFGYTHRKLVICRTQCPSGPLTVLQLRVCGLEHCHITNGHAGDRVLDVLFSCLFAIFSEPHSYRNYQTHPYLWNNSLHQWPRISEKKKKKKKKKKCV